MTLNCDVLFLWWGLVVWGRNPTTWSIEKGDTLKWTFPDQNTQFFLRVVFFGAGQGQENVRRFFCQGSKGAYVHGPPFGPGRIADRRP